MTPEHFTALAGLGQMAFMQFAPRMRAIPGFGQDEEGYATSRIEEGMEPGDYHIIGSDVILRARPDASSAQVGVLQRGEGVYVMGEIETDPNHIVDVKTGAAIPNPDPNEWAGIDYVHVGTKTHGPGWVAIDFLSPGAGTEPQPQPKPQPEPQPGPAPAPAAKKDLITTVLVGGLIGVAVLGGIVLLAKQATKPSRRLAHA